MVHLGGGGEPEENRREANDAENELRCSGLPVSCSVVICAGLLSLLLRGNGSFKKPSRKTVLGSHLLATLMTLLNDINNQTIIHFHITGTNDCFLPALAIIPRGKLSVDNPICVLMCFCQPARHAADIQGAPS
jgi:hypothetical protein